MPPGSIHIGTSGFSYKHWRADFYPEGVKAADYLSYYAQHFSVTEINASFYRLPSEETIETWANKVPDGFLFCPKMSRFLTHIKKLRDPEEPMARFFDIFYPLKKKMGPVLIQLPEKLGFKREVAEHFYKLASSTYSDYHFVVEVRNQSWMTEESMGLLREYNMGFVISSSGVEFPYAETVTANNIYVRFHGPRELYASSYSDAELKYFAKKLKAWKKKGHKVWAFFNNDIYGYAPVDAKRLEEMVK